MKISRLTAVALFCVTVGGVVARADGTKAITARAAGYITYRAPCASDPRLICQHAFISGQATHIGRLTGVLSEQINFRTGTYTGTAVFTTPNGDTIDTSYTGVVWPIGSGAVAFNEWHTVTAGTGRFDDATGDLFVTGGADAAGRISIDGVGSLNR
jgi:hypothetical protein